MDYEIKDNILSAKDFLALRESAGWGGSPEHVIEVGLKNSLSFAAVRPLTSVMGI